MENYKGGVEKRWRGGRMREDSGSRDKLKIAIGIELDRKF